MSFPAAGSRARVLRASALASLCGLSMVFVAPRAFAQSDDAAAAQALFEEGKKALQAGDFNTACPKLAESQKLDPGAGTLFMLAICHEKAGLTASAWAEYLEVVTEAQRAGGAENLKRADYSKQHAGDLEPKLSKLTITVAPETGKLAGLSIKRDDKPVRQATWGVALPVDPGTHNIEVTATGKQKWTSQIEVGAQADSKSIAVPGLEDDATNTTNGNGGTETSKTDETSKETPQPSKDDGSGKRVAGLVVGGIGVVGIGLGSFFGITAISKSSDAKKDCSPTLCTDSTSVSTNNDAKSAALIADIGFGAGVVALGVGAFLFLTAPSASSPAASQPAAPAKNTITVTPYFAREGGGAAVLATF
jgi:serine/threonine-protein kinase